MIKTIIYSCVFFNETYINLINLLLKVINFLVTLPVMLII